MPWHSCCELHHKRQGGLMAKKRGIMERKVKYKAEKIENFQADILIEEYLRECVDVPTFLEFCKECSNYGRLWCCPPYTFDVEKDYWDKYRTIRIMGRKLYLPKELTGRSYTQNEEWKITEEFLIPYKAQLEEEILLEEKKNPGSVSLSSGACLHCERAECARLADKPCRFPNKMRYSIESLGGNVGKTVTKYLHQELQWVEEGKLPEYFMLIYGLLIP